MHVQINSNLKTISEPIKKTISSSNEWASGFVKYIRCNNICFLRVENFNYKKNPAGNGKELLSTGILPIPFGNMDLTVPIHNADGNCSQLTVTSTGGLKCMEPLPDLTDNYTKNYRGNISYFVKS